MALNFPNSPTDGQVYTDVSTGNRWAWDSANTCWKSTSVFTQSITIAASAPGDPVVGQLWWNQEYGRLLVYYNDGTSTQWVDASPSDYTSTQAFNQSNNAYALANASFNMANGSYATANLSFVSANTANTNVGKAYDTSNAAFAKANSALANSTGTFVGDLTITGNVVTNITTANTGNITVVNANTVSANIRTAGIRITNFSFRSSSGNQSYMLHNNVLYSTGGNQGWLNSYLGRGSNVPTQMSFDNWKVTPFPETTATIIDYGAIDIYNAFALFSNGNLYTWGNNGNGQLGVGDTTTRWIPTLAATGVTNAYGCWRHSYAGSGKLIIRKNDGYLYVTGYNGNGQLGLGDTTQRTSFTQITSLGTDILNVWSIGTDYGCLFVQKTDYTIWAAGYNGHGQLGVGDTTNRNSPVNVTTNWGGASGRTITKMTGGAGYWSSGGASASTNIMLLDDGTTTYLRTCGYNGNYELGDGSSTSRSTPVIPFVGSGRIADVSYFGTGGAAVYALKSDGTLYVWGYNGYGQLGIGSTTSTGTPTTNTSGVAALMNDGFDAYGQGYVSAGFIKKTDGKLYSCGYNGYGQCGVGDSSNRTSWTRVLLPGNFTVAGLAWKTDDYPVASYVAYSTDGRAYCWGYNGHYSVTNDNSNSVYAPVQMVFPWGG